ncbi:MAG TPA: ABC transporter permease [Ohtaekwangia sp.]|nr:ABC transporter permease [Ohtaekwangia sp.]
MIRNLLTVTLRGLFKNGIYSFINIFGLAIGLACCTLILLWVRDEVSFDRFHEKSPLLYRVYQNIPANDGIATGGAIPLPLGEYLKSNEAAVKRVALTDWGSSHLLNYKEQRLLKDGLYAGEDFLTMFTFPLRHGNAATALKDPGGIVLTASTANAIFGDEEPMGKIIRVDDQMEMTVTGIIEDVPAASTFQFDYILPFSAYITGQTWVKAASEDWETNAFQLYVELQPDAAPDAVQQRIANAVKAHVNESQSQLILHPATAWRLYSMFENGKATGGSIEFVRSLSIVAAFILVIACINFMNLATARSERRAREVGIRKTVGSRKGQLVVQFLGESLCITILAFILSLGLVEISLPFYNDLVNKSLFIPYAETQFWSAAMAVVLLTGLLAGSYPAFYLSSFRPASVLKGRFSAGRTATPRRILVTLQFCFTIFQIVGTIVFFKQIQHGKTRDLGYDRQNLIMIENNGDINKNYTALKNDLIQQGLAVAITKSNSPVTSIYAFMDVSWPGKPEDQRPSFATIATEYDYTKTLGASIMLGRDFSPLYNDSSSVLLNQAAVDYMGLYEPLGKTIIWDRRNYTIIGVTENVLMGNPYKPVDPMMVVYDPTWVSDIMIRLPDGNLHETLNRMEATFKKYNPTYPFVYRFADDQFNQKFTSIQLIGTLANIFSALAITISCLGLFGLAAFTAEQRTKEIGIRKVMGATVTQVILLLSRDFTKLVVIAFVVTAPAAWFLFNLWLNRFPYRIEIHWTIPALAGFIALTLALATVSYQAVRAAVANPVDSLRNE